LTGAGFSYPFGGKLASEIWATLFSRPQVQERPRLPNMLIDALVKNRGFEVALEYLHTGHSYTTEDINAMESAVIESFIDMDSDIGDSHRFRDGEMNIHKWQGFLQKFQGPLNSSTCNSSFIFTLNQDLLLERHWYNFDHNRMQINVPGIPHPNGLNINGRGFFGSGLPPYSEQFDIVVPREPTIELKGKLNYVKLHGSFNWRSEDGTSTLVIGGGKPSQIARLPILRAYSEIFRATLQKTEKLLVIGYSFHDEHINDEIAKATVESGLSITIWDPYIQPIIQRLTSTDTGKRILKNLRGTYTIKLHEAFPMADRGLRESSDWYNIKRQFFEEQH
jgi:hypothetical protein